MMQNAAWFDQVKKLRNESVGNAIKQLKEGLFKMGFDCSIEQENAWKGS